MTPEAKARLQIDSKLEQAGWVIQDFKQLNLSAATGVAVREYPTDTGPADYVLFINRVHCGVIEAKKDTAAENITATEDQTERNATANLKWRKDKTPLPRKYGNVGVELLAGAIQLLGPRGFFRPRAFAQLFAIAAAFALLLVLLSASGPVHGKEPANDEKLAADAPDPVLDPWFKKLKALYGDFEWRDGTVVGIIDGDTIDVKVSARRVERIRLNEIDAPERGAPYWKRSKAILSDLVFDQEVGVVIIECDRDGRAVGRIFLWSDDGERIVDVSREMVARGAAWYFEKFGKDRSLRLVQENARKAQVGLWSLPPSQRIPPWDWRKMPKAERDKYR